jgi:hypothetical protein
MRTLTTLLGSALVAGLLVVGTPDTAHAATFSLSGPGSPVTQGDTFDVVLSVQNAASLNAILFDIAYDAAAFELVSAASLGFFSCPDDTPDPFCDPAFFDYLDLPGLVFGLFDGYFSPDSGRTAASGDLAKMTFKVLAGASPASYAFLFDFAIVQLSDGTLEVPPDGDLTPAQVDVVAAVPEPALVGLLMVGSAWVMRRRHTRSV